MVRLNEGYSTGSCAAAAAKAAAMSLLGQAVGSHVDIPLPSSERLLLPVLFARNTEHGAEAAIRKDGGDDPDVTSGLRVVVQVQFTDGAEILFRAGEGVGTVTLAGLSLPVGEPAINPGPRKMIVAALREVIDRGCCVTVSVPGGREVASKTFNPRLGIVGGLSILGTTGRVRPFSLEAMQKSLLCGLDVAIAAGIDAPVFVPGNIGEKAAKRHLNLKPLQVVEVGNEWGVMLDHAAKNNLPFLLTIGHPGKLAKLWLGDFDTHSSRSSSAVEPVRKLAMETIGSELPVFPTVEGILMALSEENRKLVSSALSLNVRKTISDRMQGHCNVNVALVNMAGEWLGSSGDLTKWR